MFSARVLARASAVLLLFCAFFGVSFSRAQDQQDQKVADAARQERARKEKQAKKQKHVYTADDLKRSKILTEEDRERYEASRKNSIPVPAENAQAKPADSSQPAQPSLGEVARQYRKQQQARQTEESARLKYEMKSPDALASPAPANAPVLPPVASRPLPRPLANATPVAPFKLRSPFERPPLRPELPLRTLKPAPATSPSQPTPQPAQPALQPVQPAVKALSGPLQNTVTMHTVQLGDSLWRLAKQNLGRGSRWHELLALNPRITDPNQIGAGSRLYLPVVVASSRTSGKIQVRAGDTLWGIARAQFGRGAVWGCIASANPQLRDGDHIFPGQVLTLPASCAALAVVSRP